jgi:hypothetical protein
LVQNDYYHGLLEGNALLPRVGEIYFRQTPGLRTVFFARRFLYTVGD